jgi:hypothetical protein
MKSYVANGKVSGCDVFAHIFGAIANLCLHEKVETDIAIPI